MASFWGVLKGAAEFLDPTPGNLLSKGALSGVQRVLAGGPPQRGAMMTQLPGYPVKQQSSLGIFDYLVPDVIEEQLGTLSPVPIPGTGTCGPPGGPVVVAPMVGQRLIAPPGYRIVECPKGSGRKVAMREETARAYGYIRARRKPPISVKDWRSLMAAERTAKKIDKVVQASNRVTGKARYRRSSGRASVSCTAKAATTRKR